MEFRILKYFHRVAQLGSFTKAAQELYIAQPALSKQISQLEQELGVRLFDRLSRGIRLTEAGKILLLYSEKVLGDWWELEQKLKEIKRSDHSYLRLAIFPTCLTYVISDFLVNFLRTNRQFDVEIEQGLTEIVIEWVLSQQVEAGIVVSPVFHPRLKESPLYIEEFGLLVAHEHPWYGHSQIPVSYLDQYPIIIPSLNRKYYRDFIMTMLQQYNVQLTHQMVVHNYEINMRLARAGLAAALVPLVACKGFEQDEEVKIIHINPPLQRKFAWIERYDRKRSSPCDVFFQQFTEYIQEKSGLPSLISRQEIENSKEHGVKG